MDRIEEDRQSLVASSWIPGVVISRRRSAVAVVLLLAWIVVLHGGTASAQGWSPVGTGLNNEVNALHVHGDLLVVGGRFTNVAGNDRVVRWNGTGWSATGWVSCEFTMCNVYALATFAGGLYAGGSFYGPGYIGRYNAWNEPWQWVGTGVDNFVFALAEYDSGEGPELYAAGQFDLAGGVDVEEIAKWDGQSWSAVAEGLPNSSVNALAVYNGELYAGGHFKVNDGAIADCIAKWDGASWSRVGAVGTGLSANCWVRALAVHDGDLYVGGAFYEVDGNPGSNILKWDGASWSPLGTGVDGAVRALTVYQQELYLGGWFDTAGGNPASRVARWTGTSFAALGPGVTEGNYVDALAGYQGHLYVGGKFQEVADLAGTTNIARWSAGIVLSVSAVPATDDVHLSWIGSGSPYFVECSTFKDFSSNVFDLTPPEGTSETEWDHSGVLNDGEAYYYRVTGTN